MPLSFEPATTQGQFLARSGAYTVSVGATDSYVALKGRGSNAAKVLHFSFDKGSKAAVAEGVERLPGVVNYYRGNDPRNWRVDVPTFAKVSAKNVYPGVDVVYYGDHRRLEFDFVVAPKADPSAIALAFTGADKLSIAPEGDLVAEAGGREVRFVKPFAYQQTGETKAPVIVSYALDPQGRARMMVGDYDKSRELVIDPVLTYSTFLGGTLADTANGLVMDAAGNAYVAGETCSNDFIAPNPNPSATTFSGVLSSCNAYVTKLNPTGTAAVYTTFIGGTTPNPATASAAAIAIDTTGQVYVAGTTNFFDLPGTGYAGDANNRAASYNGGDSDAFITILNSDGTVQRATYLGGSNIDQAYGIVVDQQLNVSTVGQTCSSDFPAYNSIQAKTEACVAFITKLDYGLHIPRPVLPGASPLSPRRASLSDACVVGSACPAAPNAGQNYYFFSTLFGGQPLPPESTWPTLSGPSYRTGVQVPVGALTIGTPDCKPGDKPQVLLAEPASDPYVSGISGGLTWPCSGSFMKAGIPDDGGFVWYDLGDAPAAVPYATTEAYGVAIDPVADVFAVGGSNTATLAPYLNYGGYRGINYGKTGPWVIKLDGQNGNQIYATSLGTAATDLSGTVNAARGIAVDTSANAYVVGTAATGILTTAGTEHTNPVGGTDAFVVKLNKPASAFTYGTYLGGTGDDEGLAIAVDIGGSAYISGSTKSSDLPLTNPISDGAGNAETALLGTQDAFIARITPNATATTMMAYLGGASNEQGNAIALGKNSNGDIYVAGTTQSVDFPVLSAAQAGFAGGTSDGFVTLINGASFPQASVSPAALGFGNQNVGTNSATKSVVLTNTGNGILNITSIGLVNSTGDYIQTNDCGTSLTPAGGAKDHCTITVTFTPIAGGSRSDVVQIVDNSANSPQTVALSGTGVVVQGSIQLSPASLAFGNQETGTTSAARTVTVNNSSSSYPLTITGIALAGDFKQTNNCPVSPATLAANASCQIQVTFTPSSTGSKTANLSVTGVAANSPQSIAVTGTGTTLGSSGTPDFTLTSSSQGVTAAYTGGTATFSVFATPLNGFNKTVNFTCSIPNGATCTVSPNSLIMDGTSVPSVTATVTIAGSGGGAPPVRTGELHHGLKPIFASLLPFCVIGMVMVGKNRRLMAVLLIVLVATLMFTVGCGGGNGNTTTTSNANTMTPGVYQVTITGASTGTGAVTHAISVPLTVN